MKRFGLFLTMMIAFGTAGQMFAQSAKEVKLNSNKQTLEKSSKLTFKLIEMEDSRCPPDVNCIWAGNAKVKISIAKGKSAAKTFELNSALDPKSIVFEGYEIVIKDLPPTPKSTDAKPSNYSVKLTMTKMPKAK